MIFNEPSTISINNNPLLQGDATREDRLRMLRHDALQQHLGRAAIFFAEKVMAMTGDTNDVYFLAQAYYESHLYEQALDLLNKKQTLNKSVQCRYLAGLCAIALEHWQDALDYLGHDNPFVEQDFHHHDTLDGSVKIKLEAIMCYARGNAFLHLNQTERAKDCFKEALNVDVKCYDALEALVRHNMLEEKTEWEFIMTLPYEEHCQSDSDLFRSLYMLQLKRYSHSKDIMIAQHNAENDYRLANSLDVMQSTAETLLAESKYEECIDVCKKIRSSDGLYRRCLPIYLACLYELRRKSELYELAQELVDRLNNEAVTWYAVGMYYLCVKRYAEARQYFSQSTSMDQHFEASWLGFGHAFAAEHDHEQAINAYLECTKLVPGSHLPYMYIGIQYMKQNNMDSALEYLDKSLSQCDNDPFLYNEFGVYYYNCAKYDLSLESLQKSLRLAKQGQAPSSLIWEKLWENLGHTYRKLQDYGRAIQCFKLALTRDPQSTNAHAGLGIIYHIHQKYSKAIVQYNLVSPRFLTGGSVRVRSSPIFLLGPPECT
ncbi:ApcC hetero-tetramer Cut9-Hcn1 [Hesseltinella vesiculosa]|uniref:ApcC hetero-tetramer Cut9-Hcn1 n=1 Tax=Hesseltinella vesiculosa TaxID=101127 RepID=A0A1X2GH73_9FUNG|nr:ApcC hetero-tetramer Cut9-Hcn1 [Hesseltinella vesiculosa]